MNLHWHRKNAGFENIDDYHGDLILLNAFNGADEIVEILNKNGVFDSVKLINRSYNSGPLHSVYTVLDALFPMFYLKHHHYYSSKDIKNKYDIIVVPKYTAIVGAIWRVNSKAKLHLYEDGLGSYSLNKDLLIPHSRIYKLIYEKNLAKDFTNFESLYLNVPELYSGPEDVDIIAIPKYDHNYLKHVKEMFKDISNTQKDNKNIYWLAQTLENDVAIKTIKEVLDLLLPYKEKVLYCPHPRWPEREENVYDTADDKQIWELKILEMDDINHKLLISIHSTACLTPKMLYDKEPYIILFYKLIDDKVTERNSAFDVKINKFINMYKNKDKIMIPSTKQEFVECINKYLKNV